jgi:pimeloyl-ACP methyl ester carboxylesterase
MPSVAIVEVAPRDGLQSHDALVDTDRKVAMIERLVAAGLTEIETTSFAHPRFGDCVLVGHSEGGGLCAHAAARRPDCVRAAVLIEPVGLPTRSSVPNRHPPPQFAPPPDRFE